MPQWLDVAEMQGVSTPDITYSMHIRRRIMTRRNATDKKRIRVGQALELASSCKANK